MVDEVWDRLHGMTPGQLKREYKKHLERCLDSDGPAKQNARQMLLYVFCELSDRGKQRLAYRVGDQVYRERGSLLLSHSSA